MFDLYCIRPYHLKLSLGLEKKLNFCHHVPILPNDHHICNFCLCDNYTVHIYMVIRTYALSGAIYILRHMSIWCICAFFHSSFVCRCFVRCYLVRRCLFFSSPSLATNTSIRILRSMLTRSNSTFVLSSSICILEFQ